MDANGLKFCMLAAESHWAPGSDEVQYDRARRTLRLARHRDIPDWPADETNAAKALAIVPQSVDRFGTRAFWSAADAAVVATGAAPGNAPIFATGSAAVTDVAIGYDDLLYLAMANGIVILDPRGRFAPTTVPNLSGFSAARLAANPAGGVWALDSAARRVALLVGAPSTIRPHSPFGPNTFRPSPENPNPPRLAALANAEWPGDEDAVAIASSPGGRVALLLWKSGEATRVRLLGADGRLGGALLLAGAHTPFSFAWNSEQQIALMLPGLAEAPVYSLDDPGSPIPPGGDFYPLKDHDGGPFRHTLVLPPQYPSASGTRGLYRLSLPAYTRSGEARNAIACDSGRPGAIWHRLYLEAEIPEHCGATVWLGATDDSGAEHYDEFPHRFGAAWPPDGATPFGAWVSKPSEAAFQPSMLACPAVKNRSGLFTALIQRAGKKVRSLRGRYLRVRVELQGTGIETPKIAALRAYSPRFSYAERYLPELYREDVVGAEADQDAPATPADFLERMLDNFEGVLTPLEDRIADSYLLTRAATTPAESLEWLGNWIGVAFDSAYTETQRRELLAAAPELFRLRGTLRALGLALDVATGGAVRRGQIAILEDYRLRRTFATILGAELDDRDDPLLAGIARSGNSFVGETLFLGDEQRQEFLALFGARLPKSLSEQRAVSAFLDGLANRVTILVHQEIDPQDLALVRRVAALETPAHVSVRVQAATNAFRAGVASLVGVDTYLAPKPRPRTARIDVSYIGRGDLIERAPALDPRLGGEDLTGEPPVAEINAPAEEQPGESFELNAAGSHAFEGRKIVKYIWTMLD